MNEVEKIEYAKMFIDKLACGTNQKGATERNWRGITAL